MRRKPLLLALTAIVCLALCVALAGVQVYVARTGTFTFDTPWSAWSGWFAEQRLVIMWSTDAPGAPDSYSSWDGMGFSWESLTVGPRLQREKKLLSERKPYTTSFTYSHVVLPYWFLYTLLLVAPGGWVWGRYRRRRQGRGFPVIVAGEAGQPQGAAKPEGPGPR